MGLIEERIRNKKKDKRTIISDYWHHAVWYVSVVQWIPLNVISFYRVYSLLSRKVVVPKHFQW